MVLVTTCEVCITPKVWQKEDELILLRSTFVLCPVCRKASTVTKDLKVDIIKNLHTQYHQE